MYCGTCGDPCLIPDGFKGIPGLGCVQKKDDDNFIKVIRCIECVNKYGIDLRQIHACIKLKDIPENIRGGGD